MAAQVGVGAVVVQARRLLQLVEHGHKALGRKAGLRHHAIAHTVGLALHVAREIKLVLRCHGLAAQNQGVAGVGIFAGGQRAQNHGANHPGRLLALLGHEP